MVKSSITMPSSHMKAVQLQVTRSKSVCFADQAGRALANVLLFDCDSPPSKCSSASVPPFLRQRAQSLDSGAGTYLVASLLHNNGNLAFAD
jgi:hypothetical protein